MTADLQDRDARDAILNDLDTTLIVEAAAGTGKTTALVGRIGRLLATGRTKIESIVAVTFTEKAAGELKLRLRELLERERERARRSRARSARRCADDAGGGTRRDHSRVLRRSAPRAPGRSARRSAFSVLTQSQSESLFGEAFRSWLQDRLADPPEGLRRALRRSAGPAWFGRMTTAREDGPADRLRNAAWELAQWRDFTGAWTSQPFDRVAAIDALLVELHEFADLTASPSYNRDYLYLDTAPARHVSQEIRLQQAIGTVDYDGWESRFTALSRNRPFVNARHGRGPDYRKGLPRPRVIDAMTSLRAHLDQFRMDADAELAALLQQELAGAVERYEEAEAPRRVARLPRSAVEGSRSSDGKRGRAGQFPAAVHAHPRRRVPGYRPPAGRDPAPPRVVRPVGYGLAHDFACSRPPLHRRRPETVDLPVPPGGCWGVCGRLPQARGGRWTTRDAEHELSQRARAAGVHQYGVRAGDDRRCTDSAGRLRSRSRRSDRRSPRQPSVVALPVPRPYGQRQVSMMAIEKSLPDAVGAFVEWLVTKSGWSVTERRGAKPEPLRPRHVVHPLPPVPQFR